MMAFDDYFLTLQLFPNSDGLNPHKPHLFFLKASLETHVFLELNSSPDTVSQLRKGLCFLLFIDDKQI